MSFMDCFIFTVVSILLTGAKCEVTFSEVIAAEGSQVVLPCQYSDRLISHPTTIVWSHMDKGTVWRKERNGLEFRGSRWAQRVQCPHNQFGRGTFNLEINSVTKEDGGLYSCKVDGEKYADKVVMLRIITVSISPPAPISGTYASLTCVLTPWRHGVSVAWMLNNTTYFSPYKITEEKRDALKNLRVTEKESGTWTCSLKYDLNNVTQASATLSVSVKGIIQPSEDDTKVYAAVGSPATLPCMFSSDLRPLSSGWKKVNAGGLSARDLKLPPLPPSSAPARPRWDKSLHLSEVTYEDEGNYTCAGTVGGQKLTRAVQLVVAKVVSIKKKGSTTLTCQLSDASEVIKHEWVRVTYDQNGTSLPGPTWEGENVTINDGSEDSRGEWTCSFYGKEGLLGNVTYNNPLMSGLSGRKSSGLSNNTATVVGLGFLLAVLLLILAQMYKNHQRRKRIFQYPALETIVHTISNEREERERSRGKD